LHAFWFSPDQLPTAKPRILDLTICDLRPFHPFSVRAFRSGFGQLERELRAPVILTVPSFSGNSSSINHPYFRVHLSRVGYATREPHASDLIIKRHLKCEKQEEWDNCSSTMRESSDMDSSHFPIVGHWSPPHSTRRRQQQQPCNTKSLGISLTKALVMICALFHTLCDDIPLVRTNDSRRFDCLFYEKS
jgi:hypothetical protein